MKYLFVFFLFLCFQFTFSQNGAEKISISFKNSEQFKIIKQIEDASDYKFYFVSNWLDDSLISGTYNEVSINYILNEVFKNTIINYYITSDNKIILTRNSYIYDTLPIGFFEESESEAVDNESKPILYIEDEFSSNIISKTVRIGKESSASRQKSYTLSGIVKNSNNSEPIADLALIVTNKNINAITNTKGFYTIKLPPGINFIETKALGILNSKKRIIIYSDGTLNFNLEEGSQALDEVIVEADKDRNVKEAITGITQIEIENIKNIPLVLGERDILKVATTLPGIKTVGEGSSGYSVRGGKEDQNLILLDNGVIYNPSHFFGIFSALNPFTSGDVNIYKGTIPAEFGGRLSSVFDINTRNGNTKKFSGEASIGPVTSNLTLEIPVIKNKSSFLVGARGTYSDWILKSLDEESLKNSKASFYDAVIKYSHEINDTNTIEASAYYSNDIFSITSDSIYNYSNRLLSLKWDHSFNDKNRGSFILANSQYQFNIEFEGNSDKNFDLRYNVNETELKLKMKYLLSDSHKFDYGLSSKLYIINPGEIDPLGSESIINSLKIPEEKALESAVYVSDNFEVSDKLLLNFGIRYSFYASLGAASQRIYADGLPRNEGTLVETQNFKINQVIKTYGGPEFRASVRYFLGQDFSIKGSYNSTYQYIHTLSNNTTVSPLDTWRLSDLNIKPQQATQYSLGFYKNLDGNIYEFSFESYFKKSTNILDYKVGADLLLNEAIETEVFQGEGKAYGIEFLAKKTKGRLNGWLGYTYSRSLIKLDSEFSEERVNGGNFFPSNSDKPHDVSLVANYKLTKRFSLSTNFTYQTGRPVTYPIGSFIFNGEERVFYSNRNEFRIPDYYRLDIGLNIEGNHKNKKLAHSFWNISIYNVLGRNNPYSVFFVTEGGEVKAFQSSIFSIPVPTITYNLKF